MLKNKKWPSGRGFTVIEVVLVLAIAGLIFLMVFLALPALRVGQRDQQRRSDAAMLRATMEEWRVNSGGSVIDSQADIDSVETMFAREHKDPTSGQPYNIIFYSSHTNHESVVDPPLGSIAFVSAHVCGSDAANGTGPHNTLITSHPSDPNDTNLKRFALLMRYEGGNVVTCVDNDGIN